MSDVPSSPLSPPPAMGDEAMQHFFTQSNAARQHISESAMAADLDALGDYLLSRSEAMEAITAMAEPARNDAISLAREILRKLKVSFGAVHILDGLGLKNAEDGVLFGSIRDAVQIYEHMLAWAVGIDASILSDPSIQAAISAIGKIGYLAKRESLRLAKQAHLTLLANRVMAQLAALDARMGNAANEKLDGMLDTIERGMNRVMSRTSSVGVSGAAVSHAQESLGHFMSAAPTAGVSRQMGKETAGNRDAVGKRNAEMQQAEAAAQQAEAARVAAQNAKKQRNERSNAPPRVPTATAGRQAMQQLRAQQRRQQQSTGTAYAATHPTPAPNRQLMARLAGIHHAEEEAHHHEHELHLQQQMDVRARQQAAQKAAAQQRAAMQKVMKPTNMGAPAKSALAPVDLHAHEAHHDTHHDTHPAAHSTGGVSIDPNLLKGIDLKGFDMRGVTGAPVATGHAHIVKQLVTGEIDPNAPLPPMHNPANKGQMR